MSSEPCPRHTQCSYKERGALSLSDRGGDCYRWFVSASRYVDEEV